MRVHLGRVFPLTGQDPQINPASQVLLEDDEFEHVSPICYIHRFRRKISPRNGKQTFEMLKVWGTSQVLVIFDDTGKERTENAYGPWDMKRGGGGDRGRWIEAWRRDPAETKKDSNNKYAVTRNYCTGLWKFYSTEEKVLEIEDFACLHFWQALLLDWEKAGVPRYGVYVLTTLSIYDFFF